MIAKHTKQKSIPFIKKYGIFILTLIITLVISLSGTNHSLFFFINEHHTIFPDTVWETINYIAWPSTGILPILLILITLIFHREKTRNVILLILIFIIIFYLLKTFTHEARVYIQYQTSTFYWLNNFPKTISQSESYLSFPSGHVGNMAIFIFTLSYLFAQNKFWLRTLLLIPLALTMLARICTGWHFPLDVLAAVLIAFILVQICMNLNINIR